MLYRSARWREHRKSTSTSSRRTSGNWRASARHPGTTWSSSRNTTARRWWKSSKCQESKLYIGEQSRLDSYRRLVFPRWPFAEAKFARRKFRNFQRFVGCSINSRQTFFSPVARLARFQMAPPLITGSVFLPFCTTASCWSPLTFFPPSTLFSFFLPFFPSLFSLFYSTLSRSISTSRWIFRAFICSSLLTEFVLITVGYIR